MRTASQTFLFNQAKQNDTKTSFVIVNATVPLLYLLHFGNNLHTRVSAKKAKTNGYITKGMRKLTHRPLAISKQGDMQEKKAQRVRIHLKNGRNLKSSIVIDVQNVMKTNRLPKIILYPCLKVAQIISTISNRFVETAIVRSGHFNIHQHPELLEAH